MPSLSILAAVLLGLPVGLFIFYLAYVTLWRAKENGHLGRAPRIVRALAFLIVAVGLVLDVFFNVLVGTALFLEPPDIRRLTFTARCQKWMDSEGWRGDLARWFCEGWLNVFDPGHC